MKPAPGPVSFEDALRRIIREEMRAVLREELAAQVPRDALLTLEQAAQEFSISRDTLRRWMRTGRLRRRGAGKLTRVRREDVAAALQYRGSDVPAEDELVASLLRKAE